MSLVTPVCERLGIDLPIFGFSHSLEVTAAISLAGGLGVFGATRDTPDEIAQNLSTLRQMVGGRPFGVDLVLPQGMPAFDDREAIERQIPMRIGASLRTSRSATRYRRPPDRA